MGWLEQENQRFLIKTEQINDLIWPGKSYVREQAKGLDIFSLFIGAIGSLASLPLSDKLGC